MKPPSADSRRKIRVLIADDHDVVRSGLETLLWLSDEVECVGQAENGAEAVRLCLELQPDIILMDVSMPVMDGIEASRLVRSKCPQTRIIALTSFGDQGLVRKASEAGAVAYLLKNVSAEELIQAIHAAYEGQTTYHADVAKIIANTQD